MNNAACCCMKIVAANGPRVEGVGGLQAWVVQSSVATMVVALVMATACAAQIARAAPAVVSAFYMVRFSSRQRRAGSWQPERKPFGVMRTSGGFESSLSCSSSSGSHVRASLEASARLWFSHVRGAGRRHDSSASNRSDRSERDDESARKQLFGGASSWLMGEDGRAARERKAGEGGGGGALEHASKASNDMSATMDELQSGFHERGEKLSKLSDSIYFMSSPAALGSAFKHPTLYVNLFVSSTVAFAAAGVSVIQHSTFPDDPGAYTTRLTIAPLQSRPSPSATHVARAARRDGRIQRGHAIRQRCQSCHMLCQDGLVVAAENGRSSRAGMGFAKREEEVVQAVARSSRGGGDVRPAGTRAAILCGETRRR